MSLSSLTRAIAIFALLAAGSAGGQDASVSLPSPGEISVSGIAPTRFNPTHGTVFFSVRGAFFPSDSRDVAVIIDDRQLPGDRVTVTRRIVSASYIMGPGRSTVTLRAWDVAGQVLTASETVWSGDLTLAVEISDGLGAPVKDAELVASLAREPAVRTVVPVRNGRAEVVNLPDADIRLEVSGPSGRSAVAVVPARDRRVSLALR